MKPEDTQKVRNLISLMKTLLGFINGSVLLIDKSLDKDPSLSHEEKLHKKSRTTYGPISFNQVLRGES